MTLRVTFLGTSGAVPTPTRNPIGLAVRREGDLHLFDVGEGIQRQMMRYSTGFALDHVFVTHAHGDHVLGLPGLLETLAFNDRRAPLTVHAPLEVSERIERLMTITTDDPPFPLRVVGRAPGDVALQRDDYQIRTIEADHDAPAVGYVLEEDERPGRFDKARALELGVPEGPLFGRLQAGESVELEDGSIVEPEQVLGPPRPGRTVVYSGDTRPTDALVDVAEGADLLVHEATFGSDRADRATETGHSTAEAAGRQADQAGVRRLALVHTSSRYAGRRGELRAEAEATFDGKVLLPDDGDEIEVSFPG